MMKQQVRIIGGKWRGRKISFPETSQVRPTPDRVKETLFNWLAPFIVGTHCLELFAGSASLSFEALSRHATHCTAVEKDPLTVKFIHQNASVMKVEGLSIVEADCFQWLTVTKPKAPFDIVFIDPPYALAGLQKTFSLVNDPLWLKPNAFIYFESDIAIAQTELPDEWLILKSKKAGRVLYYLVQAKAC